MHLLDDSFDEAVAIHRAGKVAEAIECYRRMVTIDPSYAKAWHLWGVALHQQGEHEQAVECIERAIALRGDNGVYYGNLGVVLRAMGRTVASVPVFQRAVELSPQSATSRATFGITLTDIGRGEEGRRQLETAIQLDPTLVDAHVGLGYTLSELGEAEASRAAYLRVCELKDSPGARVLAATQLPPVYRSREELLWWRERLERDVQQLLDDGVQVDLDREVATPIFSLAHQGLDDLALQRKLAQLYRAPETPPIAARRTHADGKIHVGFLSNFFRDHTIGKLMRGLVAGLDRTEFHVSLFSLGFHQDATALAIGRSADRCVTLSVNVREAREALASAELDVLFFADIGMDPSTYSLAFSRYAPVQCVTWGHPVTTGIDTIDYFVSSELLEPPDGPSHYHERLVRLETLPFCYDPPSLPEQPRDRASFGLDADAHLYTCPQSIYKFHPDFDPLLASILRGDPRGHLVLIEWIHPLPDEVLLQRWRTTMPDVLDRVRFVRRMSQNDFLSLLAASDVLLDPVHFTGGNSSCEALALGVPIVTLPGRFMRGRVTAGIYRQMGLDDLIADSAEQYIAQAVRLGTDRAYHEECRRRIVEAHPRLYEDRRAVRALEAFFRRAVAERAETSSQD